METGGRTVLDSTVDACLTADDLDLQKTAAKLAQAPSCKVLQQDLSPKKLKVALPVQGVVGRVDHGGQEPLTPSS